MLSVLSVASVSSPFSAGLGDSLSGHGQYYAALTEYLRLEYESGLNPALRLKQARCYIKGGFIASAEFLLEPVIDRPGDTAAVIESHLLLAEGYLRQGQLALARFELNHAQDYPLAAADLGQVRLYTALARIMAGQKPAALSLLDSLAPASPAAGQARELARLLQADLAQKRLSPAGASLKSAFLPGWGQWAAGQRKNAVNAFLLNAFFFSALAYIGCHGYRHYQANESLTVPLLDLTLVWGFAAGRYYNGGRGNAYRFCQEHNDRLDRELIRVAQKIVFGD